MNREFNGLRPGANFAFAIAGALYTVTTTTASAQWTVVNLHPTGTVSSEAFGVHSGQQVGFVEVGQNTFHASLWNGSAGPWIDLNPAGATRSQAFDAYGGQQAGFSIIGNIARAGIWNGSAESWVDLMPVGASWSVAWGTEGGQQVGYAIVNGSQRGSLWTGSAASWIDLTNPAVNGSYVYGVGGGQQVGVSWPPTGTRASLWSGSAASWIDLTPPGLNWAQAWGTDGVQQVGEALFPGAGNSHAVLWSGTAASWVDLHPAGATGSVASDVDDGIQVGRALFPGGPVSASVWYGTPGSWVNLHSFLPPGYNYSEARRIWCDGQLIYVVGVARRATTLEYEAVLWYIPEPVSGTLIGVTLIGMIGRRPSVHSVCPQAQSTTQWANSKQVIHRESAGRHDALSCLTRVARPVASVPSIPIRHKVRTLPGQRALPAP